MKEFIEWTNHFPHEKLWPKEQAALAEFLSQVRGYHLLSLGAHRPLAWLPPHRLHASGLTPPELRPDNHPEPWGTNHLDALPIREASIDAIIAPYIFEFCETPDALLAELFRCLAAEGKLFILSFQKFHPWRWQYGPACPNPLSGMRLKAALKKHHFSITQTRWCHYGAIELIEAQKKLLPLTPMRPAWQKARAMPETELAANANVTSAQSHTGKFS